MGIGPNSLIMRAGEPGTSRVDQDLVILNLKHDRYVALDRVGRRIWEMGRS